MTQVKKKLAALALAGAMALTPMTALGGAYDLSSPFAMSVSAATVSSDIPTPTPMGYTSTADSVTISWTDVIGAEQYYVYLLKNGTYKLIHKMQDSSLTVKGLTANTSYSFKICAVKTVDGKVYRSKASSAIKAKTKAAAPVTPTLSTGKPTIKSVSSNASQTTVRLKWTPVECTGYIIYAASYPTGTNPKAASQYKPTWKKVAQIADKTVSQLTFNTSSKAKGGSYALANINAGGRYGYRFAVTPYTKSGSKTVKGKSSIMSEPVYNISAVTNSFGSEFSLLKKVLAKNKTSGSLSSYKVYTTEKVNGKLKSKAETYTISAAEKASIEKFAKKHFKSTWSDAQKVAYTVNWINKNVIYDTDYTLGWQIPYSSRAYEYKLGQCDTYNGAVASLLTYLGYKNVYLQRMNASALGYQHFRTEIQSGGKTYSIESGNASKSDPTWVWICRDFDEVPLK